MIRRYPGTTKPNGVLEESATYAVRKYMTASDEPFEEIHRGVLDYARYGITTAQDGAASPQVVQLLQASAAYRKFPIDVVAYQTANERYLNEPDLALPVLAPYENGFRVGGVKMVLDGSPQGKTAYLTKPYEVQPHGQHATIVAIPSCRRLLWMRCLIISSAPAFHFLPTLTATLLRICSYRRLLKA